MSAMYDYVESAYPAAPGSFQTKDLPNLCMTTYTIDVDGWLRCGSERVDFTGDVSIYHDDEFIFHFRSGRVVGVTAIEED